MSRIRVNVATPVATTTVRAEVRDGRNVLVVPSKTLPDNIVMNGVLYPADEIAKSFHTLEGTQAPFGHPQVDGQYVNALHPVALNSAHIGAHNENVRQVDGVVLLDKVIDVEVAERTEQGRRVLDAINKADPIHTSTGLTYDPETAPPGQPYHTIARNMIFDHDCILLDEPGAATPAQGVGMMVNSVLDAGMIERRETLTAAVRLLAPLGEGYYWLRDYDAETAVFDYEPKGDGGSAEYASAYTIDNAGVVALSGEIYPVRQVTTWERVKSAIRSIVAPAAVTSANSEASKMDETKVQAMLDQHMAGVTALLQEHTDKTAEALTAVNTNVEALAAEQRAKVDAVTAANRAIVTAKHGEVVANALEGDALAEMAQQCQRDGAQAAPLTGANAVTGLSDTLPE